MADLTYAEHIRKYQERILEKTGKLPYLPGVEVVSRDGRLVVNGVSGLFKAPPLDGTIKEVDKYYRQMVAQEELAKAKKVIQEEQIEPKASIPDTWEDAEVSPIFVTENEKDYCASCGHVLRYIDREAAKLKKQQDIKKRYHSNRDRAIKLLGGKCEICTGTEQLIMRNPKYPIATLLPGLWDERLDDVLRSAVLVCRMCCKNPRLEELLRSRA